MQYFVINFLFFHQSSLDYFLTRGRLLFPRGTFAGFLSQWKFCQLQWGPSFDPRHLHQIELLRNMPWRSDSDLTLSGEREKQKKHECKKARQSKKIRESHKTRDHKTKQVFCSISDLYALYYFFSDFPIIQLNNINPNII